MKVLTEEDLEGIRFLQVRLGIDEGKSVRLEVDAGVVRVTWPRDSAVDRDNQMHSLRVNTRHSDEITPSTSFELLNNRRTRALLGTKRNPKSLGSDKSGPNQFDKLFSSCH